MKAEEIEVYRNQLQKLVKDLSGGMGQIESETFHPKTERIGEMPGDDSLQGSEVSNRLAVDEVSLSVLESEGQILRDSKAALQRIADGKFGKCEECQGVIAKARLQAVPYAKFCIRCAQKAEAAK